MSAVFRFDHYESGTSLSLGAVPWTLESEVPNSISVCPVLVWSILGVVWFSVLAEFWLWSAQSLCIRNNPYQLLLQIAIATKLSLKHWNMVGSRMVSITLKWMITGGNMNLNVILQASFVFHCVTRNKCRFRNCLWCCCWINNSDFTSNCSSTLASKLSLSRSHFWLLHSQDQRSECRASFWRRTSPRRRKNNRFERNC